MRPRGQAAARPTTLALVSVNVGGVRSAAKLQQVLQWARTSEYHVIMLQEVGLAAHPLLDLKGAPGEGGSAVWAGSAYFFFLFSGKGALQGPTAARTDRSHARRPPPTKGS